MLNAVALFLFIGMAYHRHKAGLASISQEAKAVSILEDPRRLELIRKRDSLRTCQGGGSLGRPWANGLVVYVFFIIALSLGATVFAWRIGGTWPWFVDPIRFWIAVAGSVTVAILWYFVREFNGIAAQALQEEIDAMDRAK